APEKRRSEPVQHRGPDELDRVGKADQAEQADCRQVDALDAQPGLKRGRRQVQRHSGGKPQEQQVRHLAVVENLERRPESAIRHAADLGTTAIEGEKLLYKL